MEVQAVSTSATSTSPSRPMQSAQGVGAARRYLGTAAGAFLGAVFLVAAYAKALDPAAFAEQIRAQGLAGWIAGWPPPQTVVYLVLGAEVALGVLLMAGVRRWWVLAPATALVVMFVFLTGRDAWLDARGLLPADAACGCFGNLLERTPAEAFRQDLAMLVPSLALAMVGRRRPRQNRQPGQPDRPDATPPGTPIERPPLARVAFAALATGVTLLFAWRAPALPLDNLATRLKPGVAITGMCAGRDAERICLETIVPELGTGEHLVVLVDLADPAITDAARQLNAYAGAGTGPRLWLLTASPTPAVSAFFWKHGPTFEIREAPAALLRPLVRALPRAFVVRDGRVLTTHSGWPEVAMLIAPSSVS